MSGKLIVIWFAIIIFGYVLRAESRIHVGPWGGHGGNMWNYEPKGDISHITLTYDDFIHSICFTSIDENGNLDKSRFPCKESRKTAEITIDVKTEKLNGISGTFDTTNKCSKTITSLCFTTSSNKTYGPFGTLKGKDFSLMVEDEGFTGIYGSSGWLLDGIGVSLHTPPTGTTEDVGIWGGPGGHKQYDYKPTGIRSNVSITYERAIRSFMFTSIENGIMSHSERIGAPEGYAPNEQGSQFALDFNNGERLTGISGKAGYHLGIYMITSLKFYTNKGNTFGPYGSDEGDSFSYFGENSYISGFYGHDGAFLDSMGIHVQALPLLGLTFGEWGNKNADNAWSYQPEGGISHISITHGEAIYSINFTAMDEKGKTGHSRKFGKGNSGNENIDIDPTKEKLSGIRGTVGAKKGREIITSLTFFTDNNRTFGPFGTETGTEFSVPLKDGFISGFHGRSDKWLESIGVYAKPI